MLYENGLRAVFLWVSASNQTHNTESTEITQKTQKKYKKESWLFHWHPVKEMASNEFAIFSVFSVQFLRLLCSCLEFRASSKQLTALPLRTL